MEARPGKERIGGSAVHVGDCYVWASISYLDSSTDYRECLPPRRQRVVPSDDELGMLDERSRWLWARAGGITILALLTSIFLLAFLRVCD